MDEATHAIVALESSAPSETDAAQEVAVHPTEELAAGVEGDTIVWTGSFTVNGVTINTRDKFVRKSAKQIDHTTEADMGGTWTLFNQETCLKKR